MFKTLLKDYGYSLLLACTVSGLSESLKNQIDGLITRMAHSLYQCLRAKVHLDRIVCGKGHPLSRTKDGTISLLCLRRGEPLEITVCQDCPDYDEIGSSVGKEDRGW